MSRKNLIGRHVSVTYDEDLSKRRRIAARIGEITDVEEDGTWVVHWIVDIFMPVQNTPVMYAVSEYLQDSWIPIDSQDKSCFLIRDAPWRWERPAKHLKRR